MAKYKRGKSSFLFSNQPVIASWASIAGKKESEGPLGRCFDKTTTDTFFGQKTWEQAEKKMQELALKTLAEKAGLHTWEIELVFSGDLLNQCIGSSFSLRNMNIPHLGLYGACSTMSDSLLLAALTMRTGSLLAPMLVHAVYNLTLVLLNEMGLGWFFENLSLISCVLRLGMCAMFACCLRRVWTARGTAAQLRPMEKLTKKEWALVAAAAVLALAAGVLG